MIPPEAATIATIAVIPLIIGLVQAVKAFFPPGTDTRYWFGLSLLLGLGAGLALQLMQGDEWTWVRWVEAVVYGLAFALAAGKAYDVGHDGSV